MLNSKLRAFVMAGLVCASGAGALACGDAAPTAPRPILNSLYVLDSLNGQPLPWNWGGGAHTNYLLFGDTLALAAGGSLERRTAEGVIVTHVGEGYPGHPVPPDTGAYPLLRQVGTWSRQSAGLALRVPSIDREYNGPDTARAEVASDGRLSVTQGLRRYAYRPAGSALSP